MKSTRALAQAIVLSTVAIALAALPACRTAEPGPQYARPLPEGAFGLRRITDPSRLPDLDVVLAQLDDTEFDQARQRSLRWFAIDSTRRHFPVGPISHAHAQASVYALGHVASLEQLRSEFDVWESVGWDGQGTVLYTGYYSPVFRASRTPTAEYRYPLYRRPPDLVTDPATGQVLGRETAAGVVPYPTRRQIEQTNLLRGQELVYLPSELDAYLVHVNGSAKLNLTDGSTMYVGYAGTNGREYTSIARLLVDQGKLDPNRVSLATLRSYFLSQPGELHDAILHNDRFVFFREYDGESWPAGSLGFKVTPMRTLATDKAIFPRGSIVLVDTSFPTSSGGSRPLQQLMLDQDTGGAIRAAGRADIYVGIGPEAERLAGRQLAEGRLYYLLLRPDRVPFWLEHMRNGAPATAD